MNKNLAMYFSKRILLVTMMGFSSGLPLALVISTLSLWLNDYHIAYSAIGAFALVRLPYSFKWLWAPAVDAVRLPILWKLGKRRSWAIFSQVGLLLSIFVMSRLSPDGKPFCFDNACSFFVSPIFQMAVAAGFICLFSATQDIVLDAFRVELCSKDDEQEVAGAAMYILGYRLGLIISSAGAIGLAAYISWNTVYLICSLFVLVGIIAVLSANEPKEKIKLETKQERGLFYRAIIAPFVQFMQKPYWLVALLLVFFYRLSDSYFGLMAYPFYADMGFSKGEIAYITKLYGMGATIIGGLWGAYLLNKLGLMRGMLIFSVVQGVTTALYIPLCFIGHSVWALIATISLENLSSGIATTAIIAFMSVLCDKKYTATQYALLSSLTGVARDVFSTSAGFVLEATSWPIFFLISSLLALPGFGLCWFLYKKKINYGSDTLEA